MELYFILPDQSFGVVLYININILMHAIRTGYNMKTKQKKEKQTNE